MKKLKKIAKAAINFLVKHRKQLAIAVIAISFFLCSLIAIKENISKPSSTTTTFLTFLVLLGSENKLLQNFVSLNDKEYSSDKAKLTKKFVVIFVTSLITFGSAALFWTQLFGNPHTFAGTDGLLIIILALQIIILVIIIYLMKRESKIIDFIKE